MSEKSVKNSKGKTNTRHQVLNSGKITQIVCFAIVATAAVFGFVQARRALYEIGGISSSVISGDKYTHGDETDSTVDSDVVVSYDGQSEPDSPSSASSEDSHSSLVSDGSSGDDQSAPESTEEKTTQKTSIPTTKVYADGTMVKITVSPVNVRSGAGEDYRIISKTSRGETFCLLSTANDTEGNEWSRIALSDNRKGWILSSCCRIMSESELTTTTAESTKTTVKTETTTTTATTTATSTTAKSTTATSTTAKSTTATSTIAKSTTTTSTTAKSTTTKRTTAKSTTAKTTTAVANADTVVIKASPANIRSGAGTSYKVLVRAQKGDTFRLLSQVKTKGGAVWYQVALDGGKSGWIKSKLCRLTKSADTASKTTKSTTVKSTTTKSTTAKSTTSTTAKDNANGKSVEISVSPVNIRSGAGMEYSVIARTERGKVYRYLSSKKDSDGKEWHEIALEGDKRGWVLGTCCRVRNGGTGKTTAKSTTASKTTKVSTTTTTTKAKDKLLMSIQPEAHSAKYFIVVYKGSQSVVVYGKDKNDNYTKQTKVFTCSTGKSSKPTKTGKYRIRAKYRWRLLVGDVYGQYNSSIGNNYLFHSVPYHEKDPSTLENEEYNKLGSPASKGCIRMCVRDCKWIYDNCAKGTDVRIVDDKGPAGPGVPKRKTAEKYSGWDPSDKWSSDNPYFA